MRRRRKSRYQREQEQKAQRYRATLSLVHRAERLLMKALTADYSITGRTIMRDKQHTLVNAAAWRLRDALRK